MKRTQLRLVHSLEYLGAGIAYEFTLGTGV